MNLIQIAENVPTIITTATTAIEAIDAALPAIDKLFVDVDSEAKADFASALTAVQTLILQVKTLFLASTAPAPATAA